ncbi:hypothetical protein P872_17915 [Rhodonellum psychrophilum GCM71 = DSM 17998]|uniref:Neutral/alkaline non-lysosomal ceramidase N-terminal domain-containing protein n=2 Tax=Rhodonellum TaxID=336827 RepID=U5C2U3_9BACT|nr:MULTISPECIES: hypothetical protein [Rhodonellum]ERM82502.1 hypothetical protein P872_17915 [Rhodonellum psychrophilum GCM71 = DSM 17998]
MSQKKSIIQKSLHIMAWILGTMAILVLLTITWVDWEDYREKDYYTETMSDLQELQFNSSASDTWMVGWSTINATPEQPTALVGYRPRGNYEFVLDSSYVKTLVLGNGKKNVAILNYELLIVHPYLSKRIQAAIRSENLPIDFVYFTATHTHSGHGGYIPGLMGKLAFGGFDETIVSLLEQKTIVGIKSALATQDTAVLHYQMANADSLVANRFKPEDPTDPFVRQLVFEKRNGQKGTFLTYSAHPTILSSKYMGLSGDYPFYFNKALEQNGYVFSLFAAGTVGSHRPVANGNQPEDVKQYALDLNKKLPNQSEKPKRINKAKILTACLPIELREVHYRLSDNIRLRPWIFNWAFGETNAHFDILVLGNTLLIGSSGEISGVFYDKWEKKAAELGLNLIITSFNGGYIGYITPDKYYQEKYHEVRDMNWFGPYNGAYFDEIIGALIEKQQ